MNGAKMVVESLKKEGVKHIFGYPGGSIMPVYDVLYDEKNLQHILVRHEQCAAHAADGYARASGKTGCCMSTSGPGATNLVTGITTAFIDSSPIVAISGQVATHLIGNDAFQEADMIGITLPVTKQNYQITRARDIPRTIGEAFHLASTGRPGPVFIDLPVDVQKNEAKSELLQKVDIPGYKPKTLPHPVQVKRAVDILVNAGYPFVLIGGGIILSNAAEELKELISLLKCPIAYTMMGKGGFPDQSPYCFGMIGMHGKKIANYALTQCDALLTIGCRFSDRITGDLATFGRKTKLIHVDIDPAEIGKNIEAFLPIVGDAKQVIKALNMELKNRLKKQKTKNEWGDRIKQLQKDCECDICRDQKPIHPYRVVHELNDYIKDTDIVTTEVGLNQLYATHFLKRRNPRTFITSGGLGTMGFGFPAAMGAKVAKPKAEVYDFAGDGSFQMVSQELATCKQHGIKVVPLILNNAYLGNVRLWQELFMKKRYSGVDLGMDGPDYVKLAKAYGLEGVRVERPGEIKEALKQASKATETFVIDIIVERESGISPMLVPGKDIGTFTGECMQNKALKDYYPTLR